MNWNVVYINYKKIPQAAFCFGAPSVAILAGQNLSESLQSLLKPCYSGSDYSQ